MPNEILKEVIGAYPEILLEAYNSCFWDGRFFVDWKKQRLVLLRKGNKPLGESSPHRPICLLDTIGKALGGNDSAKTTGSHGRRERSLGKPFRLSERHVVDIATNARRGTSRLPVAIDR